MFSFNELLKTKNRTLVMGILNITPDSFSDGAEAFTVEDAVEKLKRLCDEGADIIDVGACSTAPQNETASEKEELKRLRMFLPEIIKHSTVPVSLDTFRPTAAKYALSQGVSIINDESGIFNIYMAELVSEYRAGWIFMHTGGADSSEVAEYSNGVLNNVSAFFESMKNQAIQFGIEEEQLCYDFGIGFGKTRQNDLELLSSCHKLSSFSPLLVGVSRKRIIGEITGTENPKDRLAGSVAAAVLCAYNGTGVLRVHDVKETVEALKVTDAFKRGIL